MNVFDKEVVKVMDRVAALTWRDLTPEQLVGYYKAIANVERKCKWFHTSLQAKNLMIRIKREMDRRLKQVRVA